MPTQPVLLESESTAHKPRIYSVTELNQWVRCTLQKMGQIWIGGEISNLSQPQSGHAYFSLKDQQAQIRCALFRSALQKLKFKLANGQQVMMLAEVSLYEPRGDFQLIALHLELAGDGALQLAFEQLKKRLAAEGLFDVKYKKSLPTFPKTIGIVSSATGAAIRDILTVLKRRFPSIPVIIYPTLVQGQQAALQIVNALEVANRRQECDVLILGRGGGSLEDLWPFNEEIVARAIFASQLPIITGIGHEIDFTIADFVADLRAPTPSAAAEHATPSVVDFQQQLVQLQQHLCKIIHHQLKHIQVRLTHLQERLCHPGHRIQQQMQQIDQLEQRFLRAQHHYFQQQIVRVAQLTMRLKHINPQSLIHQHKQQLVYNTDKVNHLMLQTLEHFKQHLHALGQGLHLVSPLATLQRGFAIASKPTTQQIIRNSREIEVGESLNLTLAKGQLTCTITHRIED